MNMLILIKKIVAMTGHLGEENLLLGTSVLHDSEVMNAECMLQKKINIIKELGIKINQIVADAGDNAAYEQLAITGMINYGSKLGFNVQRVHCLSHSLNLVAKWFIAPFERNQISNIQTSWCSTKK